MKIKRILYLLLIVNFIAKAQNNENFIPQVAPLSPDVAGLMKYIEIPVNTYNGTMRYDVPLYNLKQGDLSLPISLSYYNNGLKVKEEASSVGLGWTLNAGGVIQKIPKKLNYTYLDLAPLYAPLIEENPNPTTDYYQSALNTVTNITHGGCKTKDSQGNIRILDINELNYLNSEKNYDMYMYNFAGFSGKFIDVYNGDLVDLNKSNIKFEKLSNGNIVATATNGNKYYFNTKATNTKQSQFGVIQNYTFYLSQIVSPKNDIINFSYVANQIEKVPSLYQSFVKSFNQYNLGITKNFDIQEQKIVNEYLLDEINSSLTKIKFFSSSRLDIYNGKKNNQIKIYKQGEVEHIKNIIFNYNYFTGSSNYGDFTILPTESLGNNSLGSLMPSVPVDYKRKRLKLLSIDIKGSNENEVPISYSFDYNLLTPLPYKTSLAQDLWGYFNGSNNTSLLPNVNNLGYYDKGIPAYLLANPQSANRKSNEQFMKAGILTKVTLPTKGYSKIEYEINSFEDLPGTSSAISQVEKNIHDINSKTEKSLEFTIPNISQNQVQNLTVWLICNSFGPCDSDSYDCAPAFYSGSNQEVHPSDDRLYARIEKKNGNVWTLIEEFDKTHPELVAYGQNNGACGLLEKGIDLVPGTYRMVVNYPDNKTGYLGGPWAFMSIRYFDYTNTSQLNTGAGLRVKSVSDYSSVTEKSSYKSFNYKSGKLLSKPVFYSYQSFMEMSTIFPPASGCHNVEIFWDPTPTSSLSSYTTLFNDKIVLASDPMYPYSYAANGSLVGYDEIDIHHGENIIGDSTKYLGMETYKYKNQYLSSQLPGIPGGKIFGNGSVLEKSIKKILNPGEEGPTYFTQLKEEYHYELKNLEVFWAYKMDYFLSFAAGEQTHSRFNFIHFYPIKSARQILKKKTITEYYDNNTFVKNSIDYLYNNKHQLISEKQVNSKNEVLEKKIYYPYDLLQETSLAFMPTMIDRNMIDIPILKEVFIDGKQISTQVSKYNINSSTSNLLLPTEIHSVSGEEILNLNNSTNRKIKFDNYDSKGNLTQYTLENGISVSFIWGYNQSQPIAKIENAKYSDISSYVADLQTASLDTETILLSELNNFRATLATALPNSMVTTFTYTPLIGVSTITDTRGQKITYKYDDKGRLEYIKDKDDNILSKTEYNYKN